MAAFLCTSCSSEPAKKTCTDPLGCVDIPATSPVKLGVIQSLSGKVGPLGQEQMRGLELALARRGGKLLDREVSLQVEDTGCQPEGGANAALKIVADPNMVAIFGTTCSGDAATASEIMSKAGFAMISGNNSAPFLTAIGGQRAPKWQAGYFRTAPNEESSGPAAATFAYQKLGIRKAATVNDGDIYTKGLADGFAKRFQELGGTVVLNATVNKQDTNMGPLLTAVKNSKAELVFFPLFQPEGNHLLMQARRDPAMKKTVLMSDGALIEQSFIEAVQDDAVGMYFVGPTPPTKSPAFDKLLDEYRARFKTSPSTFYYVSAFDAAEILFAAIEKVATKEANGVVRIGRTALRDALYATRGHSGISGTLSCNEFGDCAPQRFNVLRLANPDAGVEGLKANVQFTYSPSP
ncbi:MAG TPA: branched-chain amino acid ABC transporter substrate-binding protein [Humidesulfovibrio sp.]|uniref:branched-chain amino acid ABC transporter substrate-binding protein n=1 Tax=Humidesulfovibrio sp. TaxID=2910988 RepID=UPI002C419DD2|nr:branched-chain amino acid ABC transporter substrate-binding protein [Humidesulfovibrio sp.]HWR03345.1 branched-chain amino acid ABC transporter substrate-binding protein [Humidesulfovibrio sp.]